MNKIKAIVTVLISIMIMSMMASAYVPPELRTNEYMSEFDIVNVVLTEHDADRDTLWVLRILDEKCIQHTNSGRTTNNYAQLREWVKKIESQELIKQHKLIKPSNETMWSEFN